MMSATRAGRRHVLARRRRREQLERRLAIPLPAGLGQQRARLGRIVGIGHDVGARAPDVGRQGANRGDAEPLVDQLDQRLGADGVGDGPADARIVERPPLRVHRQVRDQRRRRHRQPQIGVQAHERQIVGRQLLDDVGGARLQRLQPLLRIGHGQQDQVAGARRLVPVGRVALERDAVARDPLDEAVGPRADRVAAEVVPPPLHRRRRDDRRRPHRQVGQERRVGAIDLELHAQRTVGAHAADVVVGARPDEVGLVVRVLGDDLPLEREDHRLGVDRRPVLKAHVRAAARTSRRCRRR